MRLLINDDETVGGDFGVDLRRHERRVTQEFLYNSEICARLKHVCCARVTENVWAHDVTEADLMSTLRQHQPRTLAGELGAASVDDD